jgi:hypothetical protein
LATSSRQCQLSRRSASSSAVSEANFELQHRYCPRDQSGKLYDQFRCSLAARIRQVDKDINEVIANRGNKLPSGKLRAKSPIHPTSVMRGQYEIFEQLNRAGGSETG